jgi:tetratricopeptide (TPR) repeat protein/tRNA A-37 threonylcarbamoyl transferase component Bud32
MTPDRWRRLKDYFNEALDMDLRQRELFLGQVSAEDHDLCNELKKLLADHHAAGLYFDGAASEPRQPPISALRSFHDGEVICGRFAVKRLVGSGGMGEVYEAFDEIIGVTVAVKTIRSCMMMDKRLIGRLHKEVQLAREITHPNVCRVHDVFSHRVPSSSNQPDRQIPFLSMEFLPGETLAERLGRQSLLQVDVASRIILQIAEGLAAAHHAGVVHRDLKPGNVMLVPGAKTDERAVITDFGLARRDLGIDGNTAVSLAGTPGYIAPEQLEGLPATLRSDVYSFGVIVFQILVGRLPQLAQGEKLASTIPERLGDPQAATLKRIVLRCLERSPDFRFSSAEEIVNELFPDRVVPAKRNPIKFHGRYLVLLFGILVVCLALFVVVRRFRRLEPNIPRGSRLLLTDIRAPEPGLEGLTTVLRSQLAQSPQFVLIDDARLGSLLQQMGKTGNAPLDAQTAREVALRDGAPLVVYGSASVLGQEYVLALKIERVSDTPFFSRKEWREEFSAANKNQLFDAIHRAASWVRATAGEAAQDLAEQDRRPEDTTTSSWQAIQLFERARRASEQGNDQAAILVLQEALQIDPEFAMAYAKLADLLIALKRYGEGYAAWKQALFLTEKKQLTSREQLRITGQYFEDTGDYPAAERTYRTFLVHYPDDYDAGFFLASVLDETGHRDEAASRFADLWRRWPQEYSAGVHLGWVYLKQHKLPEARAAAAKLRECGRSDWALWLEALALFTQGRTADALAAAEPLENLASQYWRSRTYLVRACWLTELGRGPQGIAELQRGIVYDSAQGLSQDEAVKYTLLAQLHWRAGARASAHMDCQTARALDTTPRQAAHIGMILAQAGFVSEAHEMLDLLRPYNDIPRLVALRHQLSAEIDLAEHLPTHALREIRTAAATSPAEEWLEEMARCLEAARLRDQASETYKRILDNPALFWGGPQTNVPDLQSRCRNEYTRLTTINDKRREQ